MPFDHDHWRTPRSSIATVYADNDMGYATHGAHVAADILRAVDVKPSAAGRWSVLDFGCGTARVARILSRHVGYLVAYDPEPKCIEVARQENHRCNPMSFRNLILTVNWEQVTRLGPYDLVCAVSVFEHLDAIEQTAAMDRIRSVVKPGGIMRAPGWAVLWLHKTKNARLIADSDLRQIHDDRTVGIYLLAGGAH